jgi:predicted metalloprotease with PDZ domain
VPDHGSLPPPLLRLDLTAPHRHLIQVRLTFTPRTRRLWLRLPAWTPGSYLIRDYVRTLEGLRARQSDLPLAIERREPAHWSIELPNREPVEIHYAIQATELTVRTCHLNGEHGFLALAGVVLQIEGERWRPHRLELVLPDHWQPFVPLPPAAAGGWLARDYDQLVDTPVEAGRHPSHRFTVAGVPHRWVSWGGDPPATDPPWLADVERVCLACCRLLGEAAPPPPADHYLFVLHLLERGYGGLEHDHSCVLQYGRRALAKPEGRRKLLQLVAHEYLHQWNVRRLRPVELTPIDYDRATVVPSLWFAEGITSYLDQLLPLAAGVTAEADLLEDLGADLSRYLLTPGRRLQSLRQSSQEAWVKLYRQDAYSADNQISYYLKGAVLALVLDLHLRRSDASLGMVLRDLWRSHGRWGRGYREAELIDAFAVHSPDLSTKLPHWLSSTDDPDVDAYLADVGLRLVPEPGRRRRAGWQTQAGVEAGLQLSRVERDGPAQRAGLQVGDELLALDGQRLRRDEDLDLLLAAETPPGAALEVLYCRDGLVRRTELRPEAAAIDRWKLELDPAVGGTEVQERRRRWLALVP